MKSLKQILAAAQRTPCCDATVYCVGPSAKLRPRSQSNGIYIISEGKQLASCRFRRETVLSHSSSRALSRTATCSWIHSGCQSKLAWARIHVNFIAATQTPLLAISDAPSAFIRCWQRQVPIPFPFPRFAPVKSIHAILVVDVSW